MIILLLLLLYYYYSFGDFIVNFENRYNNTKALLIWDLFTRIFATYVLFLDIIKQLKFKVEETDPSYIFCQYKETAFAENLEL